MVQVSAARKQMAGPSPAVVINGCAAVQRQPILGPAFTEMDGCSTRAVVSSSGEGLWTLLPLPILEVTNGNVSMGSWGCWPVTPLLLCRMAANSLRACTR